MSTVRSAPGSSGQSAIGAARVKVIWRESVSSAAADRVMSVDVFMTRFLRAELEAIKARRFQIADQKKPPGGGWFDLRAEGIRKRQA
jgi:hypothetical protein